VTEQFRDVGRGVTLCYETFGDPDDTPILLIMGLATQMIAWHEEFCERLADRGFHVVRFDNRDIGRSTHFDFRPDPGPDDAATGWSRQYSLGHGRGLGRPDPRARDRAGPRGRRLDGRDDRPRARRRAS
jgi:pimeloyl-ACP methyl ester carboxylesterase